LRFSARANGGHFPTRLRRSDPDHAPSISCAAVFRYPAGRSRNFAGFFDPATLLGFDTLRSVDPVHGSDRLLASCAHLPFFEHPTPIILSGGQSLNTTPTTFATDRGRSPRLLGFVPAGKPFPYASRRMGRYCPGLAPLSGLRTPETPACRRAVFSLANPLAMGTASGAPTLMGFAGGVDVLRRRQDRRTFRDAPSGASPADPSAFVAGA